MRILITGSAGQLGQALQQRLAGFEVEAHDLATLDLTEAAAARHGQKNPDTAPVCFLQSCQRSARLAGKVRPGDTGQLADRCIKTRFGQPFSGHSALPGVNDIKRKDI